MKYLILAALMVSVVACKNGTNYQDKADKAIARANASALLTPGADYTFVKLGHDHKNWVVLKQGSNYVAVNLDTVDLRGTDQNILSHAVVYNGLTETTPGSGLYECNLGCNPGSPAAFIDVLNNGLPNQLFEKTSGSVRDLEKAAAFSETQVLDSVAKSIASEFGLSEERSLRVAKLAQSWKKLSKARALTDGDANAFTKELTGVNMNTIENAYTAASEGSADQLNNVLERAAAVNGTTPENMAEIMTTLFN